MAATQRKRGRPCLTSPVKNDDENNVKRRREIMRFSAEEKNVVAPGQDVVKAASVFISLSLRVFCVLLVWEARARIPWTGTKKGVTCFSL